MSGKNGSGLGERISGLGTFSDLMMVRQEVVNSGDEEVLIQFLERVRAVDEGFRENNPDAEARMMHVEKLETEEGGKWYFWKDGRQERLKSSGGGLNERIRRSAGRVSEADPGDLVESAMPAIQKQLLSERYPNLESEFQVEIVDQDDDGGVNYRLYIGLSEGKVT